jgi:hypothetical protein
MPSDPAQAGDASCAFGISEPQAERHLYLALLGALEAGLVRTMEDAVTVLKRARAPLGPMGAEWLEAQERELKPPRSENDR